jgi:hypothetical protein
MGENKMCVLFCSAYSAPFENSYVVLKRHRVTLSDFRVPFRDEYHFSWFARFKRDHSLLNLANQIDMLCLSSNSDSNWICSTNSFRYPCLVTT